MQLLNFDGDLVIKGSAGRLCTLSRDMRRMEFDRRQMLKERARRGQPNLREHFAGLAMQGMMANPAAGGNKLDAIAREAIRMADALLSELAKPVEPQS